MHENIHIASRVLEAIYFTSLTRGVLIMCQEIFFFVHVFKFEKKKAMCDQHIMKCFLNVVHLRRPFCIWHSCVLRICACLSVLPDDFNSWIVGASATKYGAYCVRLSWPINSGRLCQRRKKVVNVFPILLVGKFNFALVISQKTIPSLMNCRSGPISRNICSSVIIYWWNMKPVGLVSGITEFYIPSTSLTRFSPFLWTRSFLLERPCGCEELTLVSSRQNCCKLSWKDYGGFFFSFFAWNISTYFLQ